jgi:hypothetical protein
MDKEVSGNTISIIIDRKRYNLRLKDLEIMTSHQQKIDFDNTHPHRWKIPQWIKLIESLYFDTYGINPVELDLRGREGCYRRGKAYGIVKTMLDKILNVNQIETDYTSIVEFLKWVFSTKNKFPISIAHLQSDALIQEWIFYKKKQGKNELQRQKRKWD